MKYPSSFTTSLYLPLCAIAAFLSGTLYASEEAVTISPSSWEVGIIPRGTILEQDFEIRPAVKGKVSVKNAWAPCEDCLSTDIIREQGAPDDPAVVRGRLDTTSLAGSFRKVILISCSRPRIIKRIVVSGRTYHDIPEPFTIEIFFSREDPESKAAARRLESALTERGLPDGVSLSLLPIEDPENYRLLRKRETALAVKRFHNIECFVGNSVYLAGRKEISTTLPRILFPEQTSRKEEAAASEPIPGSVDFPFEDPEPITLQMLLLFSPDCPGCRAVLDHMDELARRFKELIEYRKLDVTRGDKALLAMAYIEGYGISLPKGVILLVGDAYLSGKDDILSRASRLIEKQLARGGPHLAVLKPRNVTGIEERASALSITAVAAAGLADGINPCAFATIVLFLAILSTLRSGPWKMLLAGLMFCAGVFVAYFLIGLALFGGMRSLSSFAAVDAVLHWIFFAIAVLFGVLSLADAVRYSATGASRSMFLKVPEGLRKRFAGIMRSRMGSGGMAAGAFAAGVIIAVLEGVCTGQMYLPVIGHMARTPGLRTQGHLYLLLYNVLFILPLAAVCGICFAGVNFRKLSRFLERHLAAAKVMMAAVFFLLAGVMFWYG